jgi:hypothetical protein
MKYEIIYVLCPGGCEAGGVESLYQLCDGINSVYGNCVIVFDNNAEVPKKYKNYNIKQSKEIIDSNTNLLIVPEVWTEKLNYFTKIKKSIWWLSVDNNHNKFINFDNNEILHFYQSHYALHYIINKGGCCYLPLFDYININFPIIDLNKKENLVCYNPAKGFNVTQQIIQTNPDITFVPIQHLNPEQLAETLTKSKVYIDFGNHPGRDRIPREAALFNNCVITNTKGAAKYFNDIAIFSKYKFNNNIEYVGNLIRECFLNFEICNKDFNLYRSILKQEKIFMNTLITQNL